MPPLLLPRRPLLALATLVAATALGACGSAGATADTGHLNIVAVQNFWGSIAAQLGGDRVTVSSIVTDPNADPHEYSSNSNDARAVATADYVVVNGAGYDSWASKLIDANPSDTRTVMNVADVLGKTQGDNPHFWYDPDAVTTVAARITSDLRAADPADAAYFNGRATAFSAAMQPYHDRVAAIRSHFAGVRVGATESIFVYLAQALGLDLTSPPAFMSAVSEGNEPPVQSVVEFQDQLRGGQIALLVFNAQTVTDVTTGLQQLAKQQNIPTVGVSETMPAVDATFEQWQVAQLDALQAALSSSAAGSRAP